MRQSLEIKLESEKHWFKVLVSPEMLDTFKQVVLDGALQRGVDVTFVHSDPKPHQVVTVTTISAEEMDRLAAVAKNITFTPPTGGVI